MTPLDTLIKKHILFYCPQNTGCHYNRLMLPARFCQDRYHDCDFMVSNLLLPDDKPDVIVTYGMPNWEEAKSVAFVKETCKGKHVWCVDDDYLTVPPWNPVEPFTPDRADLHHSYLKSADFVTISTQYLFDQLKPRAVDPRTGYDNSKNYYVLPNMVDLTQYKLTNQRLKPGNPMQILWVGSPTHRKDIEILVEPLSAVLNRYQGTTTKVDSLWFGDCHPTLRTRFANNGILEWNNIHMNEYHRSIALRFRPNIGLAPLFDCVFNRSRSNLKFLEYGAMGAVPLCSPVGPFKDVWSYSEGHLCESASDWYNAIVQLIENEDFRVKLGAEARKFVEENYNWHSAECRKPWYAFFDKVLN